MTPDTQQAQNAFSRGDRSRAREAPGAFPARPQYPPRSVVPGDREPSMAAEAAQGGNTGTATHRSHAAGQQKTVTRAQEDAGIVGVIPLLTVLVVTVAGVYIAWSKGSAGGGEGGVVAGAALLVAAVARLLLPVRAAGLLAIRKRPNDVVTLAIFGIGLLVAGAVLPG